MSYEEVLGQLGLALAVIGRGRGRGVAASDGDYVERELRHLPTATILGETKTVATNANPKQVILDLLQFQFAALHKPKQPEKIFAGTPCRHRQSRCTQEIYFSSRSP